MNVLNNIRAPIRDLQNLAGPGIQLYLPVAPGEHLDDALRGANVEAIYIIPTLDINLIDVFNNGDQVLIGQGWHSGRGFHRRWLNPGTFLFQLEKNSTDHNNDDGHSYDQGTPAMHLSVKNLCFHE